MSPTYQGVSFNIGGPATYGQDNMTPQQRLEAEVKELRTRFEELQEQPCLVGTLLQIVERKGVRIAHISFGNGQVAEKRLGAWAKDAKPGMAVRCTGQGLLPIEYTDHPPGKGQIVVVEQVHDGVVEFSNMGMAQTVTCALECKPGDRVLMNAMGDVVIKNLGAGGTAKVFQGDTGVDWDDIGGLVEIKRRLREAIEEPVLKADVYKRFGKKPCKGIALFGPGGTGKTMLGKAVATAMAKLHGKSARAGGFIYSKGPELLAGLLGSSESNIRALFSSARAHREEHGYPAIVFLDEADGILGRRGASRWEGAERTIVPQFLAEMDGLDDSGAIVIIATNRPEAIDPAFMRDGRIDIKIDVSRPVQVDCADIFARRLRGRPCEAPGEVMGEAAAAELFADKHVLHMETAGTERRRVTLASRVSGAMCAGIVERATQLAIRRACEGGLDVITHGDVQAAVQIVLAEEKALCVSPA